MSYWAVFVAAFAFPWLIAAAVPVHREVFQSFGADLPALTRAVHAYHHALFILPFIAIVPAVMVSLARTFESSVYKNYKVGLAAAFLLLGCVVATVIFAMYLPIIKTGTVV